MSIRHSFSQGDLAGVIMAYDDSQTTAHSITQAPEIVLDDASLPKTKSRKTWNTRRLKHFSEQLLKPFATISIKTKPKRVPPGAKLEQCPPLIIPRGAGGALPPIPKQPTAKAFNHPPPRKYQPPSPDDPSEDYLEPSRNSDPLEEENYAPIEDEYDEAEEVSCPPIRAAKHQFRELPPQPPRSPMNPHHMEEYEEPSQLDYEDADTIQPDRNKDDFDDDSDDEDCSETYAEPDEMSNPLPRRGPVPPLPCK
ncbi:hypothetical protein LSH36_363g00011 [Paralvinella palmiformis]|uniref:Uncharacterized protein n=1 Tax=Paralvinella palmiformis TaxID=53620 RepID=A0AAD9JEW1_9ANNE|nr:hypothetical protein LSH36_363g00011 [Paralvinella palmiformis]